MALLKADVLMSQVRPAPAPMNSTSPPMDAHSTWASREQLSKILHKKHVHHVRKTHNTPANITVPHTHTCKELGIRYDFMPPGAVVHTIPTPKGT